MFKKHAKLSECGMHAISHPFSHLGYTVTSGSWLALVLLQGMIPLCMTCMPFPTHRLSSQVLLSLWEETCYGTKTVFPPRSWIPVGFWPCSRYRPVNVKHACHFPLTFAYRFLAFSVLGCEKGSLLTGLKLVCFFKCTRVSVCGMYFHSFSHFILIL